MLIFSLYIYCFSNMMTPLRKVAEEESGGEDTYKQMN